MEKMRRGAGTRTRITERKKPWLAALASCLLFTMLGGFVCMSFEPTQTAYSVTVAETAAVGGDSPLAYKGVNSMVGTLISWGADNYTTDASKTVGSWYIDNNGYIVWGSNNAHNLPITYAVPKDNSLSKIQLIKANNGAPSVSTQITTANGRSITLDNLVSAANGLGSYFTVGSEGRTSPKDMAEDWEKAIVAASHYSKSGLLQNEDFGSASSIKETEFPDDDTWAADFNKPGATGGFGKQQNTSVANNTYIYIKLMADWKAPVVNTMQEGGDQSMPGDTKTYVNRFVEEAKLKSTEDAAAELGVTKARGEGFFEFDLGSNGAGNTLQTGTNGSTTNPTYLKGDEGATKESGPHFSLGTSFSGKNSISNLNNAGIHYNQFSAVPSEEPFSFGRLAIPDNCYVIVDLNGHTLDRNLDSVDQTIHENVICPSVFLAGLYSRLEVFDSSASDSNPAGNGKIMGATGLNGDGIIDGCPPDYVSRASKPAWNVDAWGNSIKGGGVKLAPRAEFTLHSGTIMHNSAVYGGAVYGTGNNYIYIIDGVMTENTACKGAATYLSNASEMVLNMFGGAIIGNGADWRRFTHYIHVQDKSQVADAGISVDSRWMASGVGNGVRCYGNEIDKKAWLNVTSYASGETPGYNVKSGEINSEGGGVCVFQNAYFNMYGGTIGYNYSYEYAGGVNVNKDSFFKMYGGEITGNVVTGDVREITGAQIVDKGPDGSEVTSTPTANVGGGGVNMFQDSAGIYLNGPGKIMSNYTCNVDYGFSNKFTFDDIAKYIETNKALTGEKATLADSNLYLSLTTTAHDQITFETGKHLYPEIKVQGPLYRDADHVAQISITPAAGVEAGGYIMRQFYTYGWEDDHTKQDTDYNGTNGARPLKSGEGNTIDESSHAKDQINTEGGTAFNLRKFLKTGATSGYVDGFLFTDGGTSIVAGTGNDEGWYMALGTKQKGNLPVKWQYYEGKVNPLTNKPYGWLNATTTSESGTGFTLVYNGNDRRYDIRVFVDRTELTGDSSGDTGTYFYLYYDYYTLANAAGEETELEGEEPNKVPVKHYLYLKDESNKVVANHTNILRITSGFDDSDMEIVQENGVIYASERYDILGYRFTIRPDIKLLKGPGDSTPTPFNEEDNFQANPNYATMKIDRATLMVSQIKLADIVRYYDGTNDFYIPSSTITAGTLTGQAPNDQEKLRMQFRGESNGYIRGKLNSPNVGTNNVSLGVTIEELGGADHDSEHNGNTFPNECLLANYNLYDLNTETMYPAEDREEMSVTLNVTVQPKPITVKLEKQSYEYGSVPMFDSYWGTHANTANWAETYEKANGGESLKDLFKPADAPKIGDADFNPNKLGKDGALAKADIDSENVDPDHGTLDKGNLALRLDQILKISFTSAYMDRSTVNTYGGTFNYTNGNYNVTWRFNGADVPGMSGGVLTPAQIEGLIEITPRLIKAEIPDHASIYGEAQETLTLPNEKITHADGKGDGLVFGDSLSATLDLADAEKVKTSGMLRATVDATGKEIDKKGQGYYDIVITNEDSINSNYQLETVTKGKYTVYPRSIVLKAGDHSSVYGDEVNTGRMGGFTSSLAETQKEGLSTSSTVIFPADEAAFNKGVSYAYTDGVTPKNQGKYTFNVSFNSGLAVDGTDNIGVNYAVTYDVEATHTIVPREVTVLIASPQMQSSEYGETPVVQQGKGTGTYWMPQFTSNAENKSVVVLPEDMDAFVEGIRLYIAAAVDSTAPAGEYPLMGRYTGSPNYEVDFNGMWDAEIDAKYKDPAFGEVNQRAGKYTINRRNIVLDMSTGLNSEYGDDIEKFWESSAYTFTRGGESENALVNGDVLAFDPALFSLVVSSSRSIAGGEGHESFDYHQLSAGTYTVLFDLSAYKSSAAYNAGDNANYEITTDNGRYTVDPRRLKVEIGAEPSEGVFKLHYEMEYGSTFTYSYIPGNPTYAAPRRTAEITRIDAEGKPRKDVEPGDGFVGSDYITMLGEFLATDGSISNYESGLTATGHLRIGTYNFYVPQQNVSRNYEVTWEYGTLKVNPRTVHVNILPQSMEYANVEPNVSNSEWELADGYTLAKGDDGSSIVTLDKEDGADAGKYDIHLICTDNNYSFVVVGAKAGDPLTKENAFTITPSVIDFTILGGGSVYDKEAHRAEIIFTGSGYKPAMHAISEGTDVTNDDGSVTYTFGDRIFTVTFAYNGAWGTKISDTADFSNVGTYTVTVTLLHDGPFGVHTAYSGNYCFAFEDEGGAITYAKSVTYNIEKATVYIPELAASPYNRAEQEANWSFANDTHPSVVPDTKDYPYVKGGEFVKYAVKVAADNTNAQLGETGLPYYRGLYEFTLTLNDEDFKNYAFAEGAKSATLDFEITPLEIISALTSPRVEYDDATRFHGGEGDERLGAWSFTFTSTTGTDVKDIGYNIEYKYNGWGATGDVAGEHTLIVKVGGHVSSDSHERAKTQYFVDDEEIGEARMYAILENIRAFIDAGKYTVTLKFENENFLLRQPVGEGTTKSLDYEYTITPVLISVEAFGHKEFNNAEQDAEITKDSFLPSSTMTAERAFELLQRTEGGYTLSYDVPEFDTSVNNGKLGEGGKPFNAGTYTVIITLKEKGNFTFSETTTDSYEYVNAGQRFVIDPFDIATLFAHSDEGDEDHGDHPEHLAEHAFDGELDSDKLDLDEDNVYVYTYTYTGMEIVPVLVKATIHLTADGEPIVYGTPDEIAENFSLGSYENNIYADVVTVGRHASLVVTGKGNYTGNTPMSFSIVPMELTAKIGEASSAYGEALNLTNDLITYEGEGRPYELDDLRYTFSLAVTEDQKRGEHVVAGTYAIKAECGNQNYNVKFTGDWSEEGDNKGTCGVYTVEKRQILVRIEGQSAQYSGEKPAVKSEMTANWTAPSAVNGTGSAIVAGDTISITLDVRATENSWNVGTYAIFGTLGEDEVSRNYSVQWEEGVFEITAVKITVQLKPQESVYDGTVPVPKQGGEWYTVTGGEAVHGENLNAFIEIYIVNADSRAFEYQLSGNSSSTNYSIDFEQSTYTIRPRAIVVTVKDAESYYGEKEVLLDNNYWFAELVDKSLHGTAIIEGDNLEIQLRKEAGSAAGTYIINTTWNNNGNYTVTFKSETNGDSSAVYTVKPRPIIIHINDQTGVYGSITTDTLSQNEGMTAAWYVKDFSKPEDAEKGLLTGDFVIAGNRLNVSLDRVKVVQPGKYEITGTCGNTNYAVTWEGDWEGDNTVGHGKDGKAGTYTIQKRAITVTVLNQKGTYGEDKIVYQNQGTAYTVACTNSGDGIAFVNGDNVSLAFSIDESVNSREVAIGDYPVYLQITFGAAEHADWYEITVEKDGEDLGSGKYKVANAYTVERRKLRVTISDLTSVYGDEVRTPTYDRIISTNVSGDPILEKDNDTIVAQILAHMQIMVAGNPYDFAAAEKAVIEVDTYRIVGENFISAEGKGNYEIEYIGSGGENGVYTVVKRDISVTLQSVTVTYGDIGNYVNDEALKTEINKSLAETMVAATTNGTPLNVAAVNGDDLGIQIFISDPSVSTSGHLKQGRYFIYGNYSHEEKIEQNYSITVIWAYYTVEARAITIRLATNNPSSEYGDPITDYTEWGYEAAFTNGGEGDAILKGDLVEFRMTTALDGNTVDNGTVTATLIDGENDNGNYNIAWTLGNYSVVRRRIVIVVAAIDPVVYGTPWEMPKYTANREAGKDGAAILDPGDVEIVISVQNAQTSYSGFLRWVDGGYLLAASVTGAKQDSYSVRIENLTARYVVNKRPITVTIGDASGVYGVALDTSSLEWDVTEGEIVSGETGTDDLGITLTASGTNVGKYKISGRCANTDYSVTWKGSWEETGDAENGMRGTYTIDPREVRIDVRDQNHAVYGESIVVTLPQAGVTFTYAEDNKYEIASRDTAASVIRFIVRLDSGDWDGVTMLDAGYYTLTAAGIGGNYNIVVESEGHFTVNQRKVTVNIADQNGIYGNDNTVDQSMQNTVPGEGSTGRAFYGEDRFEITLSSPASADKANAGTYPITGNAVPQGATKAGNYEISYHGSFAGGEAGTYTIAQRTIVVNITDQTVVYGDTQIPTVDGSSYTASFNGDTSNAIREGDEGSLALRFSIVYNEGTDLSTSGALKAGSYAIVGAYNEHGNYVVSFVGSWTEGDYMNTAGVLRVEKRSITVTLGLDGTVSSSYGEAPAGPWSQDDTSMYLYALATGTGPAIIVGDKVEFEMRTLADETSHVGNYPLIGEMKPDTDANDNENYNFTFTGAFMDSAGGAYEKYDGIAGVYTVTPRKIGAEIGEYSREYGVEVDNADVLSRLNEDGTNGLYFTLEEGWSRNGDTVAMLGVRLDCVAGPKDSAQTYTITGTASNPDYEVTFRNGEGKYTITRRLVYVVILPQASVYGKPIEENQRAWYAFRGGYKATWTPSGGTTDSNGVLAEGENLDELSVRLFKRAAIDGYNASEGSGIYGGQYAIEGTYSNPNYEVVFVGANTAPFFTDTDAFKNTESVYYNPSTFAISDEYDYAADPDGLREKDYGVYTVAPRKVTVMLNAVSGTYGGTEHTVFGDKLMKGVQLDPTEGTVWRYITTSADQKIDAGDVGYLSFYLGGRFDEEAGECLPVGKYPVVAYWGLDLPDDSRMRDWNYEITFVGSWDGSALGGDWTDSEGNTPDLNQVGLFTVGEATIEQYGTWYEALDYILDHEADPYVMSVNGSMVDVNSTRNGKRYFTFKGDIKEGEVSYGNLYFNPSVNSTVGIVPTEDYERTDEATGAPMVNQSGYWILDVTVSAKYHKTETFQLVYRITADLVVLTLKEGSGYEFTYGDYFYDVMPDGDTGRSFSALEEKLKNWLLGEESVVSAMRFKGTNVAEEELASYIENLFLEDEVAVSIHKMASNKSTGGYLNAGTYLVTIAGGSNLEITFSQDYEVVTCKQKLVSATWSELSGTAAKSTHEDGADLFTVTYDGRQHTLDPNVSGVLAGDVTTDYAAASYLFTDGTVGASATPLSYGQYISRVTSLALGGADGSNYTIESDLHAYISVEKLGVTVRIKPLAQHTYGEPETGFGMGDWELEDSSMAPGEYPSALGVVLTRETGRDVGKYKVTGTFYNDNYSVTWKGNWNEEGDPMNGTCGTFEIVPRPITVHLLDKTVTYGAEPPEGDDLASDTTLWYATYDLNVRGIAIVQGDNINLSMIIGHRDSDSTVTGYLKAGTYTVTPSYSNGNYQVTFESETTPTAATSTYEVIRRALRVSLFDATTTEYGYARPLESHRFTGFTSGDETYFEENPDEMFIRFFFYDPVRRTELSPTAEYDLVGTYAVCAEVSDETDPIGSNYDVTFVGGWDDNRYPDLVNRAGVYLVTPRSISILIHSVESEYGDVAYVPIDLQLGSPELVGSDTLQGLGIVYKTDAYHGNITNVPGTYPIEYESITNPNYRVSGAVSLDATYTVLKRRIKIVAVDQYGEYGDEHPVDSTLGRAWTAHRVNAAGEVTSEDNGIAYTTDRMNDLVVQCNNLRTTSPVGEYSLSVYYETQGCYDVREEDLGNYEVRPREITVRLRDFSEEYGEDHMAYFNNYIKETGYTMQRTTLAGEAIAFPTDPMHNHSLSLDVSKTSPVGGYPINFVWKDENYAVTVLGSYDSDPKAGTFTVTPRNIIVNLEDQTGEYGDDHTPVNVFGRTWRASHSGGGVGIIGTDDLGLVLTVNATEQSPVGTYVIDGECSNSNYEVHVTPADYVITPRKLTASVYGESQYGDPLQELTLSLTRAGGKEGYGIMPWDETFLSVTTECDVTEDSEVGTYPVAFRIVGDMEENPNYEITRGDRGEYVILPRAVVVEVGSYTQYYGDPTVEGNLADNVTVHVSRADGASGDAFLEKDGITVVLSMENFSRNAGVYAIGIEKIANKNYSVSVIEGRYTVNRRPVTVHIDDKMTEYGSEIEALTTQEIENVVEGDDLGLTLRVTWLDALEWHNVGVYAIYGSYTNVNYDVTFEGSWALGDLAGGTYTVYKATNVWLHEYEGDGTVIEGNSLGEGEAPVAKFGEAVIRYYYDEDCTQEIEGDISEMGAGVYYAKATVADTHNYSDAETRFTIEVLSGFIYQNGAIDVTLFVVIFASQFVVGICALLFVRRRKNKRENV